MATTIDDNRIIAYVEADLIRGTVSPRQVVCTQYDAEMRVIAVRLKQNGKDWEIPAGYSVNVRMRKADGTGVYNPQQGEGNIAYITLSAQMCGVEGVQKFVVEIVSGSDVAQTVPIELRVIKNPIEDQDFTSEDEKETIQQAVKDAQDAAEESQENANQAYTWNQNCITIYHQTENLKNDTQTLHDQAQTAATTAQEMAAQVQDYAEQVLGISVPAVALSQSEYDALNPPDPKTLYIVESDGPQNSLVANYPLTQNLSDGMDGTKTATATGCQGLGNWDGTGPSFNTAPASGAVGQHQNYLTLPSNLLSGMSFSDGITLALDLKPNTTAAAGNGDWTRLINLYKHGNSPAGTAEGELYLTQGLIATAYYDGVTAQYLDASKAGLITAGAWHTVALTLGGGYLSVYLDGALVGQRPDTTGLLSQLANVDANEIGNSRFADNDYAGLVRNFRIYDKALSAAEIGRLNQASTWKLYYGAAQNSTLAQLQEAVDTLTESVSTAQEDIQQAQEDISGLQSDMEKIEDGTTPLPYLPTSGGTMAGNVDMDGNALTGLPNPAEDTAAIPKGWADGQYSPLTAAIRPTVTGNPITVTDSAEAPVQGLCVYGRTEQDGTPSPENPVPLVSAEDVSVTLSDGGDGSQTLTLTGDLPGIPVDSGGNYTDPDGQQWVCNYRDWQRGVDVQMVAQQSLTGTINFAETEIAKRFSQYNNSWQGYKNGEVRALASFAQWKTWGTHTDEKDVFAINYKTLYFSPAETMTAEEVNALFATMIASDAPPTVIGQLETPVETPIPSEELAAYKALQTYDGTTNATATDGAGLNLRYIADTQKYIDNKIAAISAAMLEG